jgi:hypothetical protein
MRFMKYQTTKLSIKVLDEHCATCTDCVGGKSKQKRLEIAWDH